MIYWAVMIRPGACLQKCLPVYHVYKNRCYFRSQIITIIAPPMKAYNRSMLVRHYAANIGLWSVLFHNFIAKGLKQNWDFFHYKRSPDQHKLMLRRGQGNTLATFWGNVHCSCAEVLCPTIPPHLRLQPLPPSGSMFVSLRVLAGSVTVVSVICMLVPMHVELFLTFTDWPMVTPGCKDFSHSLAADGFTALKDIVFPTTELHHTANATHTYTHNHIQREDRESGIFLCKHICVCTDKYMQTSLSE